jgi:hypothetical protein
VIRAPRDGGLLPGVARFGVLEPVQRRPQQPAEQENGEQKKCGCRAALRHQLWLLGAKVVLRMRCHGAKFLSDARAR